MASLSSVITQTVGSSTAGVNLITAPNESSIFTATTITKSTTTTAAELPLGPSIATATKFALAASAGSAYCDFDCPNSLLNSKLQLAWFARASSGFTATITLTLQSFASSANRTAGTSPTSVTLQTSTVQGTAPSFITTFDAASQSFFRLTINFTGQASAWYSLCQLQVGPGTTVQGAAISEWTSYTTTLSAGFGGGTASGLRYKRDGSDMLISGTFQSGTHAASAGTVTLPTGFTINFSNVAASSRGKLGRFEVINSGGSGLISSTDREGALFTDGSNSVIYFAIQTGTSAFTQNNPTSIASNSSYWTIDARIPIAEWAGNGTVNLGAASVEYAYNSSTATGVGDTGSFAYGPQGATIQNITASLQRRVRFQYPIQSDDVITVEVSEDRSKWVSIDQIFTGISAAFSICPYQIQDTRDYGLGRCRVVNSTDVDVYFGFYALATGATYGAIGQAWSTGQGAFYWRVRKAKASAPVGFGMAGTDGSAGLYKAGQAPGQTTAATISAGYVGQKLDFTNRSVTCTNAGSWYANTSALTTLTAGVWLVHGYFAPPVPTATVDVCYAMISTNSTNDSSGNISISSTGSYSVATTTLSNNSVAPIMVAYVNVSTDTPIYAKALNEDRAGLVVTVIGFAVRIA